MSSNGTEPTPGEIYTVQPGDSLWRIAERAYGNGNEYTKIYEQNKPPRGPIKDPNVIHLGWAIQIPLLGAVAAAPTWSSSPASGTRPRPTDEEEEIEGRRQAVAQANRRLDELTADVNAAIHSIQLARRFHIEATNTEDHLFSGRSLLTNEAKQRLLFKQASCLQGAAGQYHRAAYFYAQAATDRPHMETKAREALLERAERYIMLSRNRSMEADRVLGRANELFTSAGSQA